MILEIWTLMYPTGILRDVEWKTKTKKKVSWIYVGRNAARSCYK